MDLIDWLPWILTWLILILWPLLLLRLAIAALGMLAQGLLQSISQEGIGLPKVAIKDVIGGVLAAAATKWIQGGGLDQLFGGKKGGS